MSQIKNGVVIHPTQAVAYVTTFLKQESVDLIQGSVDNIDSEETLLSFVKASFHALRSGGKLSFKLIETDLKDQFVKFAKSQGFSQISVDQNKFEGRKLN